MKSNMKCDFKKNIYSEVSKLVFMLGVVAVLSGCAANSLIEPGEATIGSFTVNNPTDWSRLKVGSETIWTKDGILLNRITVATVKDGQHIMKQRLNDRNKGFVYDAKLDLDDTLELFVDAGETGGLINLTLESIRHRVVGGLESVEADFYYDSEEGLRYKAVGLFVKADKKLHQLICIAPAEHYFPANEALFRKLVASARISP